ncbi:pentapeptide repeat-containing protein [Corynebacterium felinum]|uniref:Uncharacterized protein YjbI with pentapeptide repeats n=1 Tax=Corynebacterium felinum TaxID=131318 RepID=A0ABU2BBG6_9CORY|nr:pentapeptide repeat-containing protein [Corynebacterium felinum]MDF5819872.1 pentapeptide repeat-containing protein [Corynebacterium felinum]MDR7355985.1 uncharacterized protein YjbI with pentapeptide repeats [Corynebacterium felinum]
MEFRALLSCHQVIFESDVVFKNVQFSGLSSFKKAKFKSGAKFDDVKFLEHSFFDQVVFYADISFEKVFFNRVLSMKNARCMSVIKLKEINAGFVNCWRSHFNEVYFSGVKISNLNFWGVKIFKDFYCEGVFDGWVFVEKPTIFQNAIFNGVFTLE